MRRKVAASAALVAALVAAPSAHSATTTLDLRTEPALKIVGAHKVAAPGDVNGDGVPDMLVSEGDFGGGPTEGRVHVVFGAPGRSFTDLEELGDNGFVIYGGQAKDYASEAQGAGDLNGDGLDDIVVGAFGAENNGRNASGSVYVVFGKSTTEPIYLSDFDMNIQGDRGFRIDGAYELDAVGFSVAGLGDVNRDGVDDIATVALSGRAAYVIFGRPEPPSVPIDLLTFHNSITQTESGFRIDLSGTQAPYSVAPAGDVNGDALPDVVVGIGEPEAKTLVVFGRAETGPVSAERIGEDGIKIRNAGSGAIGAGDVNGDGFDDVIVGSSVVFGRAEPGVINRWRLGDQGYYIDIRVSDIAGRSDRAAGPAGDVNGDGLDDVLFGAPYANPHGREASGSVYVLYGKKSTRTLDLRKLGSRGYRIDGARRRHTLGYTLAGLADVNGDRVPDQLLSAPGTDRDGGKVFVVWGRR